MERFGVNKLRMGENLLYVLLWGAIFMVPPLNAAMASASELYLYEIVEAWCKILPYFLIFVVNNNYFMPRYLLRKQYGTYMVFDILLITLIFVLVDYAQYNILPALQSIFPSLRDMAYSKKFMEGVVTFTDLNIFWNSTFALFMTAANVGIHLVYRSISEEQKMEELKRHNMQVEMDYLKYQINPHFFMNTLNNIHALIDIDTKTAQSAVIELSKMMRYVLYESESESISLRKDVQFISNYIELMRIRFDESVDVRFNYSSQLPMDSSIPPLLFIVFIENAFKHGVDGGEGSYLEINIEPEGDNLSFTVENSVPSRGEQKGESGIGLFNVRRRLELLFGSDFVLSTEARSDSYFVRLVIPVER